MKSTEHVSNKRKANTFDQQPTEWYYVPHSNSAEFEAEYAHHVTDFGGYHYFPHRASSFPNLQIGDNDVNVLPWSWNDDVRASGESEVMSKHWGSDVAHMGLDADFQLHRENMEFDLFPLDEDHLNKQAAAAATATIWDLEYQEPNDDK